MLEGLKLAHTLPPYITVYRKGKSIDDLTLNHIMFLEDTQQFPYDISAALSDDIEKFFDRITTETQIVAMYQHGCPRHGYAERVAETSHHSVAIFTTKHAHILLSHLCGAKQGSSFACPSSNVVASLKSQAFFPPPTLAHKPLVNGYAFAFHSRDDRCLARNLILIIQSYCDDDTRYTAVLLLHHLIQQAQWSLDRAGDFSLITKLEHKHKKCAVDILNHPQDADPPTFNSTAWNYEHAGPHTCDITTNTLTTTHHHNDHEDTNRSTTKHQSTDSTPENKFRGQLRVQTRNFFGIHHTLEGDISQAYIKCLASAYARLKKTMRHRYSIVSVQTLLRTLVISVCGYNPLYSQIPTTKCLTFDRALHFKYIAATKHTVTQPAHATFLSRDHHGLHIPSLLLTQLQGRARELDVRLNSRDPTQRAPPLARLTTMIHRPNDHTNLIRDAIISLAQFGLHLRDADQPITSLSLQLLLHEHPDKTLLGQPSTKHETASNSPFTITGDVEEHTHYSHNQDLHQWIDTHLIHTHSHMEYDTIPPAPLLYDTDHLQATFVQATLIYHQDLTLFLSFTEWRTTIAQHPTQTPTHPLNAPHGA